MQVSSPFTQDFTLRCSKTAAAALLAICGLLLGAANLWYTAVRSLIPLNVDARVTSKQKLPEKHAGIDDVYLLTLAGGRTVQVDESIYEFAVEGEALKKAGWSNELQCGAETLRLQFSRDFRGMLWVMPAAMIASVLLMAVTIRTR